MYISKLGGGAQQSISYMCIMILQVCMFMVIELSLEEVESSRMTL